MTQRQYILNRNPTRKSSKARD